jgi:hypothetical protein
MRLTNRQCGKVVREEGFAASCSGHAAAVQGASIRPLDGRGHLRSLAFRLDDAAHLRARNRMSSSAGARRGGAHVYARTHARTSLLNSHARAVFRGLRHTSVAEERSCSRAQGVSECGWELGMAVEVGVRTECGT